MATIEFTKLTLRGFGVYRDEAVFEFIPGLNVYLGPNESGKSTMAAGLAAVLFGLTVSGDPTGFTTAHYYNWEQPKSFEGEVVFSVGAVTYNIRRRFEDNSISIKMRQAGNEWREVMRGVHNPRANKPNTNYLAFLQEHLGLDSLDLFRQTYYVEQPLPTTDQLDAKVQELLSGGGTHYQAVQRNLVASLKDITMDWRAFCPTLNVGRTERKLDMLLRQRRELEQQVTAQSWEAGELTALLKELDELNRERTRLANSLNNYEQVLTSFGEWSIYRERYELEKTRGRDAQNALKHAEVLQGELEVIRRGNDGATAFVESYGVDPASLPADAPDLLQRRLTLAENESRLKSQLVKASKTSGRSGWPLVGGVALGVTALLVVEGGLGRAIALALLSVGALITLVWRRESPEARFYARELEVLAAQVVELERELPMLNLDAGALHRVRQELLRYRELSRESASRQHDKEDTLRELLVRYGVAGLAGLREQVEEQNILTFAALKDWKTLIAANPGLPTVEEAKDPVAVTERKYEIEQVKARHEAQLRSHESRIFALRQRQGQLEGKAQHSVAQSEELLRELQHEEIALTREAKALGIAVEELEAAAREFQESYRERLAEAATAHFGRITASCRRVVLNEEFAVMVRTEEGMLVAAQQLSQGTQDQLYLALRFAIADLMAADNQLPLVFDDPFLATDEERLNRLRETLVNMGRQALLLTHNPRFAEWGDEVVRR